MFLSTRSCVAGLVLAAASLCAHAGSGTWTTTGPFGGSAPSLSRHHSEPATLYASGGGGVFRSLDAGANWSRIEVGLPQNASPLAIAAADGDVVYVALDRYGANRVYRSADRGATWSVTALVPAAGEFISGLSVREGSTHDLAVSVNKGVYASHDGGATWVGPGNAAGLPSGADVDFETVRYGQSKIYAALLQPVAADPTKLVYSSVDGGTSWTGTADLLLPDGSPILNMADPTSLTTSPQNDDEVYVLDAYDSGGVYSTNGGASWNDLPLATNCPLNGTELKLRTLTVDPSDGTSLWLGCRDGIFHSTNLGATWTAQNTGLTLDGSGDALAVDSIVLDLAFPTSHRMWAGMSHGGVFVSQDAGASWSETVSGLESVNIRAVAVHPANPSVIYSGYGDVLVGTSAAMWRSVDAGASWQRANTGLNAEQIRTIVVDPTSGSALANTIVYAGGRADAIPGFDNRDGGIYKSTDGGTTWATIDTGIALLSPAPNRPGMGLVRSLALDPKSCVPQVLPCTTPLQTIVVGGAGRPGSPPVGTAYRSARVYRSFDAGAHWTPSDTGLPLPQDINPGASIQVATVQVIPIVIDPINPSTMYVGTVLTFAGGTFVPTMPNGVFKSTDGGATWAHSSNGIATYPGAGSSKLDVFALALVPSNPSVIYAGASVANVDTPGAQEGRIFKSTDGAANWTESSNGIAGSDIRALFVDPADASGNTVYAGSAGVRSTNPGGVYKTTDGGATWNSISVGLPADAATALARDPVDPARIYAGTVSGTWVLTQVPDGDIDSASTLVEQSGPLGAGSDADADSTPDSADPDTATLPFATQGPQARPDGAAPAVGYVSIVVAHQGGTCTQVNNAQAIDATKLPPDPKGGTDHGAYGVMRFELPRCQGTTVDVRYYGRDFTAPGWAWRNYGPTVPGDDASIAWYAFGGAVLIGTDTWRLTISAAGQGNFRSDADTILFQGGPSFSANGVFGSGFE